MADLFKTLFLFAVLAGIIIFVGSTVATSFHNLSWIPDAHAADRTPGKSTKVKTERTVDKKKKGFDRSLDLLGDVADNSPLWQ